MCQSSALVRIVAQLVEAKMVFACLIANELLGDRLSLWHIYLRFARSGELIPFRNEHHTTYDLSLKIESPKYINAALTS